MTKCAKQTLKKLFELRQRMQWFQESMDNTKKATGYENRYLERRYLAALRLEQIYEKRLKYQQLELPL